MYRIRINKNKQVPIINKNVCTAKLIYPICLSRNIHKIVQSVNEDLFAIFCFAIRIRDVQNPIYIPNILILSSGVHFHIFFNKKKISIHFWRMW